MDSWDKSLNIQKHLKLMSIIGVFVIRFGVGLTILELDGKSGFTIGHCYIMVQSCQFSNLLKNYKMI